MSQETPKCCHCDQPSVLEIGSVISPFNPSVKHKWFYFCEPCYAWVGCHKYSKRTLGYPANSELRAMRIKTHSLLDSLWNTKNGRTKAYRWLSKKMKLHADETHIGMFNEEKCNRAIQLIEELINE